MAFGIFQLTLGGRLWWIGLLNLAFGAVFVAVPLLYRFGELIAPLTFFVFAYLSVGFICYTIGTGSGLQFYFLVSATLVVLVFGIERIVLASTIVAFGVAGRSPSSSSFPTTGVSARHGRSPSVSSAR